MSRFLFKFFIVAALIGAVGYGIFLVSQQQRGMFAAPKFMAARQVVADLLKQLSAVPDIDLTALDKYENNKDWQAALNTLNDAENQNGDTLTLVKVLSGRTGDIAGENQKISDASLRNLGDAALGALQSGNDAMLLYFKLRGDMLEIMRLYYLSRVGGGATSAPDFTNDLKQAKSLALAAQKSYGDFNSAMASFDKAAGIR